MPKRAVLIGTSNHLPEGSPQSLFEETYQVCWRPWLSTLYRFPDLASTIHYSGTVLSWLQSHHPEFIMLLEEMSSRKQLEVLGGGYFAPIMPIIPAPDRVGQLEFLSTLLRKLLGRRPRGVWLQEYAWEPSLVSTYNACGFDFCFLPASLFRRSGLDGLGPAMTEDQGRSLCVFPVLDLPARSLELLEPDRLLGEHFAAHGEAELAVLMMEDRDLIEAWKASDFESPDVLFETMFASLRREDGAWETVLPGRWMRGMRNPERGYFPCSTSRRLAAAGAAAPPVEGAIPSASPRRILLRHPESHALYAKMQFVRILVGQLRGDKSRKKSATEEVWRAQCGDAYWEGAGGGILSLPVRAAAWSALIEAERAMRQKGSFVPGIIRVDIDLDGQKEILFQGITYNAHVRLGEAALAEFDSFRSLTNYVNAMEEGPRGDRLQCFVDRLGEPGEPGPRGEALSYAILDGGKPSMTASFSSILAEGALPIATGKIYSFRRENLVLTWSFANEGSETRGFRFSTELNLSPCRFREDFLLRAGEGRAEEGEGNFEGLRSFSLENGPAEERLEFRSDRGFELSYRPLAIAKAGGGEEWQGLRLILSWDLELEAGAVEGLSLTLELARL